MKIIFNIVKNPEIDTDYIVINTRKLKPDCVFNFSKYYGGYVYWQGFENHIIYDFNNNIRDVMKIFKANTKVNFKTRI